MTNEAATTKKPARKGATTKQMGGLFMVLGIVFALGAGSFGAFHALLFFGGLVTLIVGIAQRETDNT